jgi:hypothetical protein
MDAMPSSALSRLAVIGAVVTALTTIATAQTDLDAFMKDVVAHRDDNWKKLQQYILDEREEITLNGPGGARMWGEQRDYTWFVRDGFFIRSPVKFNGATIGDADRRKAEDEYLRRSQRRDQFPSTSSGQAAATASTEDSATPTSVDGLIRQSRQPQFISSSYFLRFKFDEGRYALAGREKFEGRDVLRVEYYPTKLYSDNNRGRRGRDAALSPKEQQQGAELRRLMNKVALVTLWVEPASKQIVKYTFDNVDFDFLPVPWLIKVDTVKASMTMSQPFAEVWLPKAIDVNVALTVAIGQFDFRQAVSYTDYREANVTSKVIIR